MSTSGSSSAEKRSRSARVAPRRHVNSAESAGAYDSGDFPVLLRMPDVTRPAAATESESADDDVTANESGRAKSSRADRRHGSSSRAAKRENETENKSPGSAVARFWAAMPPRIAAGGMLLAVIGLSLFFMPKNTEQPPADDSLPTAPSQQPSNDQVAAPSALQPSELVRDEPNPDAPNWGGQRSVVATKPTAPEFTDPVAPTETTDKPAPTLAGPGDMSPTFGGAASDVGEAAPAPVTGWPEETDSTDEQPQIESAANPMLPSLNQF